MKLRVPLAIAAITLTGSIVGLTSSASAAGDTDTTFEVTAGALSFSVQETADWATIFATGTESITGSLGAVEVIDLRGGTEEWNVSAASTAFTGVLGSSSTAVEYTGGPVVESGTITVADGLETSLAIAPASVVRATLLSGNNTATWTPMLEVTMPAGALADAYSGTVTTSIV